MKLKIIDSANVERFNSSSLARDDLLGGALEPDELLKQLAALHESSVVLWHADEGAATAAVGILKELREKLDWPALLSGVVIFGGSAFAGMSNKSASQKLLRDAGLEDRVWILADAVPRLGATEETNERITQFAKAIAEIDDQALPPFSILDSPELRPHLAAVSLAIWMHLVDECTADQLERAVDWNAVEREIQKFGHGSRGISVNRLRPGASATAYSETYQLLRSWIHLPSEMLSLRNGVEHPVCHHLGHHLRTPFREVSPTLLSVVQEDVAKYTPALRRLRFLVEQFVSHTCREIWGLPLRDVRPSERLLQAVCAEIPAYFPACGNPPGFRASIEAFIDSAHGIAEATPRAERWDKFIESHAVLCQMLTAPKEVSKEVSDLSMKGVVLPCLK